MKKIFISLLAIAAIASCAKTEDVFTEGDSEIMLSPVTALQTKANYLGAVDGIVYPTQENFDVYAYWKNVEAGEKFTDGSLFLESLTEGGAEFTNKGNYWGGIDKYYWPKNGSLRFAAYSPAHLTVDHALLNDLYTVTGYEQPSKTADTWDFLVAPTSPSYSMMTATEKVAIEFQHALSWITLKVVAKDADAAQAFNIKKVTINNVNTKADFAASMLDGIQYNEWANQNTTAPVVVFEGSQMVTETVTNIESTVAGTIVIPHNTTTVTVEFDQYGLNGTADTPGMTVTLDLVLDTDNTPWEPGKHYNYNLIFGLDEILINPSVADWTEVEVGELDVDAVNVSTEAQLVAAIANGGKVTLQNDIVLSDDKTISVVSGNTVVLDLNGKTLSNETTASGNREMFNVKGTLTVNNGTITTEHTGTDLGWSAMTTIFDITGGGAVNLNNVVAQNLGGSAMNFVAHLNNWGKATLNADNSTLEATYIAVRVFNSGYDMNKVSIYNSTLKGKYCFWVHNYIPAGDAVGTDATLDLDLLNGTNTFVPSAGNAPILYGFNNPIYYGTSGYEYVAEGVGKDEEGSYMIENATGMFWFANQVNVEKNAFNGQTVKLAADIDLEDAAWTPVGQTGATTFLGVFDGQNYTISNLNVNSDAQTGAHYSSGLFGWVETHAKGKGYIKNVKIDGATVVGHHNCAALVGYITEKNALVENCHVSNAEISCTHANGDADGDKVGSLIGNATNATVVKGCTATDCTVSAGRDAGQLIGAGKQANVTDCSASNVTVTANGTGTGANVRNEVIGRLL